MLGLFAMEHLMSRLSTSGPHTSDLQTTQSSHVDGQEQDAVWLVLTTVGSADDAHRLSRLVLEARLAACVNCGAPCRSEYWWEGRLETAEEWSLTIKTTESHYPTLTQLLTEHHPYDVPEIVAIPVVAGSVAYLDWVRRQVAPSRADE